MNPDADYLDDLNFSIGDYQSGGQPQQLAASPGHRIRLTREQDGEVIDFSLILEFDDPKPDAQAKRQLVVPDPEKHNVRCAKSDGLAWVTDGEDAVHPEFDAEERAAYFEEHGK